MCVKGRVVAAALLVAAAACASGTAGSKPANTLARESVVLSRWSPPAGQICTISETPSVLPAPNDVVDTAALRPRNLVAAAGRERYALFSLLFDSTGYPVRVKLIEPAATDSAPAYLESAIRSALRVRGERASMRLRIDFDSAGVASYRVGRSERCSPARIKRPVGRTGGTRPGGDSEESVSRNSVLVSWDVLVSETGQVIDAVPMGTQRLSGELMALLTDAMRQSTWHPGREDGVPTAMRTVFRQNVPVTVIRSSR